MNPQFVGKRALVTGASRGIGRSIAVALAQQGAHVFAMARSGDLLTELCNEQQNITSVVCDLSDWDATRKSLQDILPIHLLVNNAAIFISASCLEVTPQELNEIMNLNVNALVNVSQVVAGDLISRGASGSVVNVSSQASLIGLTNHLAYCASKAAVDSITRVMAHELGPKGIRINSVNPTVVLTDMGKANWDGTEAGKQMLQRIPLKRFSTEKEVSDVVLFLLSDNAGMVHGVSLPVEGGFLISGP